jgi:hypothetical protein
MKYIVYMSTSVRLLSDTELNALLQQCRENNQEHNLTGMLLYSDGTFVQVLEGDSERVDDTYAKIMEDDRHKNIIKLDEGKLDKRLFPEWNMGFRYVKVGDLAEFNGYIHPIDQSQWLNKTDHPAVYILKTFVETNRF